MIDYRYFDSVSDTEVLSCAIVLTQLLQAAVAPRFEFGFGLSYTSFDYKTLSITGSVGTGTPPSGPGSALDPWYDEAYSVVVTSSPII